MYLFEVTKKSYPDGTIRYHLNQFSDFYSNFSNGSKDLKKSDPERSTLVSYKRSINVLFDLVHSNVWEYFFTLTLSSESCDRYDYLSCADCIHHFTDLLYRSGVKYIIVPEQHADGAWHFHGLLTNCAALRLNLNNNGYLEFTQYKYGFTSIEPVKDSNKAANYILKYMVKQGEHINIPKGKKRYFASRSLDKPIIDYDVCDSDTVEQLLASSYYYKKIDNDFFHGYIIEVSNE